MADEPVADPVPRGASSEGGEGSTGDLEVLLRATERVRIVVRRTGRSCAPESLLIRIRRSLLVWPGEPLD